MKTKGTFNLTSLLKKKLTHYYNLRFSSVHFSHSVVSNSMFFVTHGLQNTTSLCPSPTPGPCSKSCPSSQWCHPTISSSVIPFSFCLQSFPSSRSFPMSWLFSSGGQGIGASASATVLPMNIQDWLPLGLTGLISLQSKGLLRVFSSNTIQKHQFFTAQPFLWFNTHIHTWLLEKPSVQFILSVVSTHCDPMDCSMPGFPVHSFD